MAMGKDMRSKVSLYYLSECIGTALLVAVGLSVVIFDNGDGSPVRALLPDPGSPKRPYRLSLRRHRLPITLSPVGRISGAHINPIVSFAFRLRKRMHTAHFLGYIVAQLTGSIIGALPLLLWGRQGASVDYGDTIPIAGQLPAAFIGETITSFLLVAGIFFFSGHRRLRRFTPFLMPPLYCIMVLQKAPYREPAPTPPEASDPPSSAIPGQPGGSTGSPPSRALACRLVF